MRPIKLIMSAFGSYGGLETIEFDKTKNGLFLIAGDTGAGKSTIFDAIMFALYDTMSGKERKGVMMRSEYAEDEIETFVEFTFSYVSGGYDNIYTVKRYPAYSRRSKRKDKNGMYNMIRQSGKVSLIMPDGKEFSGKIADINKKLEEILGLTSEQFSKIALIAQGEFQELIMDRTGKRKEIFQQIFSTHIYGDIEAKIFERYKASIGQMKNNETKLKELINGVEMPDDSPYLEEWKIAFEKKDTESEGIINVLKDENIRLKKIYDEKNVLYLELEKEYNSINRKLESGRQKNKLIDRLEKFKLDEKIQIVKVKELADSYNEFMISYKNEQQELIGRKQNLAQAVKKYSETNKKSKEIESLKTDLENLVKSKKSYEEELKNIQTKIENTQNIIEAYEGLELEKEKLETRKKAYSGYKDLTDKFYDKMTEYEETEKNLATSEKNLAKSIEKWEESRRAHEEANRGYIACQSAFLAANLKEGMPCPVCGSLTHPNIAEMNDDVITEDMVKAAADEEKKMEKQKDSAKKEFEVFKGEIKAHVAVLKEYLIQLSEAEQISEADKNYFGDIEGLIKDKELLKDIMREWKNDVEEIIEDIDTKLKKTIGGIADRKKKQADLDKFNKKIDNIVDKISECDNKKHNTELKLEGLKSELSALKASLEYETEKEAKSNLNKCNKEIEELEKRHDILDKEYKEIQKKLAATQSALKEIKEQLTDTNKVELKELEESIDVIGKKMPVIKKELDKYSFYIQSNEKSYDRIEELMKERTDTLEKHKVIKSLHETANGKIHFQTYIQRQYFEQIIQAANKRLMRMASGSFLLKCRDMEQKGQGETGLELDVYNPLSNKVRDAHTLSGGETFMASLSMALGMADIVQNAVGRTRLDTMFIDEGFGSLSDDVRDKAVKVLLELAGDNRLVGIISHVSELKEQIPNKLIVEKGEFGSHVKWA